MVNEIQAGRYNANLTKLLSMKEGSPAPTLAPEILAAFVLESDRVEWGFLKAEHICLGATIQPAGVTTLAFSSIINPVGSGALVVIEQIWVSSNVSMDVFLAIQKLGQPTGTDGLNKNHRDTRSSTATGSNAAAGVVAVIIDGGNIPANALIVFANATIRVDPTSGHTAPCEIVLSPGFRIVLEAKTINAALCVTYFWRERTLESSELR